MFCKKCGKQIPDGLKFCGICGTPVDENNVTQKPITQMPQATQKRPEQMKVVGQQVQPLSIKKISDKDDKKKNNKLRIIAIILIVAVLFSGVVVIFLGSNNKKKNESLPENALHITDFPVLKNETEFAVYDEDKFPVEEYEIKIEEYKLGGALKDYSSRKEVLTEKSKDPVYKLNLDDGDYRITLTEISSSRTQALPDTTTKLTTTTTTTTAEKTTNVTADNETVVIIIVIEIKVDDKDENAVDKVSINSKSTVPGQSITTSPVEKKNKYETLKTVGAGAGYCAGVKNDGTVVYVGGEDEEDFAILAGWTNMKKIVVTDWSFAVGLRNDGTVVTTLDDEEAQKVTQWTDIVDISARSMHVVGLKSDGTVVAVGEEEFYSGIENWTDIVAISAGSFHTVGLKSDGTVVAAGDNSEGCCEVENWTDIVAIEGGFFANTVGLKSDGTVVAVGDGSWGRNDVSEWTDIVAIAVGSSHTLGLKSDGTVVSTQHPDGDGCYGECNVSGWTDIVAIAASDGYSVGIKSDGTVIVTGNDLTNDMFSHFTDVRTEHE